MVKEHIGGQMVKSIRVNGKKVKEQEAVFLFGMIMKNMMANLKIIKGTGKVFKLGQKVKNMMDNGITIRKRDMVNIHIQTEVPIKVIG